MEWIGPLANDRDSVGVRSALRKVGVQRIIVKPVEGGWEFEDVADLGRLVNNKGKSEGAVEALSESGDPRAQIAARGLAAVRAPALPAQAILGGGVGGGV